MFLIVFVFSTILPSVLPSVYAYSIHVIIDPLALELPAIEPCVSAQPPNFILLPLTIVPRPIVPTVYALSMLFTSEIFSFVD